MWQYIEDGGSIMLILLMMNVLGVALILWKMFVIFSKRQSPDEVTASLFQKMHDKYPVASKQNDHALILEWLKDEVKTYVHSLESGLNTIKIIASIAPLLGLLGTVIGILSSFQVIALKGLEDPTLFAGGISQALVTTVGGLIVAIPHFVFYNYLVSLLDDLEIKLEKKLNEKFWQKSAN